jgi:DNA-binding NarL/FixJ family response regulator
MMSRIGLGIPCPKCGKELAVEGGLTPELTRQTLRLRAMDGFPTPCSECGSEAIVGTMEQSPPRERSRILIVEDHPIVRRSLASLISAEPDLEIGAECETVADAIRLVDEHKPDLVLIDIALKEGNGLGLCQQLAAAHPSLPMLVLSAHDETLYAERAVRAGARGFVGKGEDADVILDAIRSVLNGDVWLSDRIKDRVSGLAPGQSPIAQLSDRELEVFELIGQSLTTGRIAERLGLSPKTVEVYRANLKRKLGLSTSNELTHSAMEWWLRGSG